MFDHALGHHGANPHASTAGPQHHNALLRQAMRWLALNLQRPIHSCKSCCSRALQCNAIQPLVVAQEQGLKLTMSGPPLLNLTSLSFSPSSPAYCTCFLQCNAMQCDAMRCNAMQWFGTCNYNTSWYSKPTDSTLPPQPWIPCPVLQETPCYYEVIPTASTLLHGK